MTEFPICRLKTRPQFDTLPVMKVTQYPLEPRDYKPFAQGLLAVDPQRLYIRLWAFETPPEPGEPDHLCPAGSAGTADRGRSSGAGDHAGRQTHRSAACAPLYRGRSSGQILGLAGRTPGRSAGGTHSRPGSSGEISINAVTANAPIPAVSIPWRSHGTAGSGK